MKHFAFFSLAVLLFVSCGGGSKQNTDAEGGDSQVQGKDYTNTDEWAWVDMGTNVLWATMNIGASHSTEFGSYLQWSPITATYGDEFSNCRLPTKADYEELATVKTTDGKYTEGPCRTTWGKVNGVYGMTYTNKKTGNAIFLPAAGEKSQGIDYFVGKKAYYWTLDSKDDKAIATEFQSGAAPYAGAFAEMLIAYYVCPVRLVKEK